MVDKNSSLSIDEAGVQIDRANNPWGGQLGQPVTVTYGFEATNDWTQFNDDEIAATFDVLQLWSDVANISFDLVAGGQPIPDRICRLRRRHRHRRRRHQQRGPYQRRRPSHRRVQPDAGSI